MATTIRETLDSLPDDARQRLIYALGAGISLFEEAPGGRFVAVHVNAANPHIEIESTTGDWACGTLRNKKPRK